MPAYNIRLAFNEDGRLLAFTPFNKAFVAMVKALHPKPQWHPEPIKAWSVMACQEYPLRDIISLCYSCDASETKIDTTIVITAPPKIATIAPTSAPFVGTHKEFDNMFGIPTPMSKQYDSIGLQPNNLTPDSVIQNMNDTQLTKLLYMMLASLDAHELAEVLKESVQMEILYAMANELGIRSKPKRIIG